MGNYLNRMYSLLVSRQNTNAGCCDSNNNEGQNSALATAPQTSGVVDIAINAAENDNALFHEESDMRNTDSEESDISEEADSGEVSEASDGSDETSEESSAISNVCDEQQKSVQPDEQAINMYCQRSFLVDDEFLNACSESFRNNASRAIFQNNASIMHMRAQCSQGRAVDHTHINKAKNRLTSIDLACKQFAPLPSVFPRLYPLHILGSEALSFPSVAESFAHVNHHEAAPMEGVDELSSSSNSSSQPENQESINSSTSNTSSISSSDHETQFSSKSQTSVYNVLVDISLYTTECGVKSDEINETNEGKYSAKDCNGSSSTNSVSEGNNSMDVDEDNGSEVDQALSMESISRSVDGLSAESADLGKTSSGEVVTGTTSSETNSEEKQLSSENKSPEPIVEDATTGLKDIQTETMPENKREFVDMKDQISQTTGESYVVANETNAFAVYCQTDFDHENGPTVFVKVEQVRGAPIAPLSQQTLDEQQIVANLLRAEAHGQQLTEVKSEMNIPMLNIKQENGHIALPGEDAASQTNLNKKGSDATLRQNKDTRGSKTSACDKKCSRTSLPSRSSSERNRHRHVVMPRPMKRERISQVEWIERTFHPDNLVKYIDPNASITRFTVKNAIEPIITVSRDNEPPRPVSIYELSSDFIADIEVIPPVITESAVQQNLDDSDDEDYVAPPAANGPTSAQPGSTTLRLNPMDGINQHISGAQLFNRPPQFGGSALENNSNAL